MAMMTVQGNNVLQLLPYDCNSDWVDRRLLVSEGAKFPSKIHIKWGTGSHRGETSVKSSPDMFVEVVEVPNSQKHYLVECIQTSLISQTRC